MDTSDEWESALRCIITIRREGERLEINRCTERIVEEAHMAASL